MSITTAATIKAAMSVCAQRHRGAMNHDELGRVVVETAASCSASWPGVPLWPLHLEIGRPVRAGWSGGRRTHRGGRADFQPHRGWSSRRESLPRRPDAGYRTA
jgi:hypothetical protein